MKLLFSTLAILIAGTAFAGCPSFSPLYHHCDSSNPEYSIEEIRVRSREPYYNFSFWNQGISRRLNVVTDGEPRDITVQTQDGSEATYSETSSCNGNKLIVLRTSEESSLKEETHLVSEGDYLKVHHFIDGVLQNITRCHSASSF